MDREERLRRRRERDRARRLRETAEERVHVDSDYSSESTFVKPILEFCGILFYYI